MPGRSHRTHPECTNVANNKAGFSKQNVNLSLYDIPLPLGKGELSAVYANETGGRDASGTKAPDSNGLALSLIHTFDHVLDENSINKIGLQIGYGAAKSFTSGFGSCRSFVFLK